MCQRVFSGPKSPDAPEPVLNTYSASLSLANQSDALFGWRPGRIAFAALTNLLAALLLFGDLLAFVSQWLTLRGVLSTGLAGLVIADYFIVRRLLLSEARAQEAVNWAGVVVLLFGTWLAHVALPQIVPIEFFTSLAFSLLCYPPLRVVTLRLRERRRIVVACPKQCFVHPKVGRHRSRRRLPGMQ